MSKGHQDSLHCSLNIEETKNKSSLQQFRMVNVVPPWFWWSFIDRESLSLQGMLIRFFPVRFFSVQSILSWEDSNHSWQQRPWASTGHGSRKSFYHPSKILPFNPSFWSLEDNSSFYLSPITTSLSFWQAGFTASGQVLITLMWAVPAASLHFQDNCNTNPVSSPMSHLCLIICRALQPSSAQFLLHIPPSAPAFVRSLVPCTSAAVVSSK